MITIKATAPNGDVGFITIEDRVVNFRVVGPLNCAAGTALGLALIGVGKFQALSVCKQFMPECRFTRRAFSR